jgi:hypothetical protein
MFVSTRRREGVGEGTRQGCHVSSSAGEAERLIGYSYEWCQANGLPGYDRWKLASPDEEWGCEPEEEGPCVCGDSGWMCEWVEDSNDPDREIVIPCTECSGEIEEWDLEEMAACMEV